MSKHTPGPWLIRIMENGAPRPSTYILNQAETRTVAQAFNAGGIDEVEANARLIAAAPRMLQELKRVVDAYHDCRALLDKPDCLTRMDLYNVIYELNQHAQRAIEEATQP